MDDLKDRHKKALAGIGMQDMKDGVADDVEFQGRPLPAEAGTANEAVDDQLYLKYADNVLYFLDFTKELNLDEIEKVINMLVNGGSLPEDIKTKTNRKRLFNSLKIRQRANFTNESMSNINNPEIIAKMVLENRLINESAELSRGAVKDELGKLMGRYYINESILEEGNFIKLMGIIEENKFVNESGVAYQVPMECYRNPWLTHKIKTMEALRGYQFANQYGNGVVTASVNDSPVAVYVNESNQISFAKPVPTSINPKSMIQSKEEFKKYANYICESADDENKLDESEIDKIIDECEDNYGKMVDKLMIGVNNDSIINESVDKSKVKDVLVKNGFDKSKFTIKNIYGQSSIVIKADVKNLTLAYKIAKTYGLGFYIDEDGRIYTSNSDLFIKMDGFNGDTAKYYRELQINESCEEGETTGEHIEHTIKNANIDALINESIDKYVSEGKKLTSKDVRELAEKTSDEDFKAFLKTLNKDEKKMYDSIVKGFNEKVSLWLVLAKHRYNSNIQINESLGDMIDELIEDANKDSIINESKEDLKKYQDLMNNALMDAGKSISGNLKKEYHKEAYTNFAKMNEIRKSMGMDFFTMPNLQKVAKQYGWVNEAIDIKELPKENQVSYLLDASPEKASKVFDDVSKETLIHVANRLFKQSETLKKANKQTGFDEVRKKFTNISSYIKDKFKFKNENDFINESMDDVVKYQKEMNKHLSSRNMNDAKFKSAFDSFTKMNKARKAIGLDYFTMPNLEARAKKNGWVNESSELENTIEKYSKFAGKGKDKNGRTASIVKLYYTDKKFDYGMNFLSDDDIKKGSFKNDDGNKVEFVKTI